MTTKYILLLKRIGECTDTSRSSEMLLFISADSDEEALSKVEEGLNSAFNSTKGDIESKNWVVESLTNPITEVDVWQKRMHKGRKSLTCETVVVGKKEKRLYVGPKGGKYIKTENGKFLRIQ